jgi:hypothetical protein
MNASTIELIKSLEKLNSKRNRVVHQAESVEKVSAEKALKSMRELAILLDEAPPFEYNQGQTVNPVSAG